ncbi:major facilitator superfamily domain-containing protein [Lyophyllum atratum]|nr:major facilitator superfamily domain-containing protein [Lyophyllum atratum]
MSPQLRSGSTARRSSSSRPYVPQPESLILSDGPVGEEAAELLEDFVHPQHEVIDADADYHLRKEHHKILPWWKTPSPLWLLTIVPFTAIAMSATIAPRIEVYTLLACSVHKPDIFRQEHSTLGGGFIHFPDNTPIILPEFPQNEPWPLGQRTTHEPVFGLKKDRNGTEKPGPACASDPVVQAAVAKLSTGELAAIPLGLGIEVIATSTGILSCLTTGWWGSFSDRHGRTRLLGISVIGLLILDFNFIFVSRNFQRLPGGYWFLVLGPTVEGCVGGLTAAAAAMHAYIADTTTEANRSRTFALSLGLLFTGMAFGPTLGSLLIRVTGQLLSVFYVATLLHLIYASMVWFVLPESLLQSQMQQSRVKYEEELRDTARDRESNPAVGLLVRVKRLFTFLSPLTVFLPELKAARLGDNPLKRKRRDWNLTLLAVVYGLAVSIMGSYTFKFQYAASTFGWSSETLGYWLTLVGAARAVFLTLILPFIIKIFKPMPKTVGIPANTVVGEEQPLLPTRPISRTPPVAKDVHSSSFDLGLAQASLLIDAISYTFLALMPTPLFFTVFSMLGAMGAGLNPAIQSVALAMYRRRGGTESGRLFGALSVVQALSSSIVGPAMYGFVYMKTVATFPRAIFILSMVTIIISSMLMSFVRLPKDVQSGTPGSDSDVLVLPDDADEEIRIGSERGEDLFIDSQDDAKSGKGSQPSSSSVRSSMSLGF